MRLERGANSRLLFQNPVLLSHVVEFAQHRLFFSLELRYRLLEFEDLKFRSRIV